MSTETIQIHLVTSWSTKDIITLYKAGGWWKESYNPTLVSQMIAGSFRFAVAVDTTTQATIGMGRVISDGISDAYIQDVIVLPKYRHKGIGHSLITRLVNECLTPVSYTHLTLPTN